MKRHLLKVIAFATLAITTLAFVASATRSPASAIVVSSPSPHRNAQAAEVAKVAVPARHRYGVIRLRNGYLDEVVGYDESDCALHDIYNPKYDDGGYSDHDVETTWHYVTCPSSSPSQTQ